MAIKLVDELKAMGNFPIAHAEGINLVKTDGTEDNLQNLFDNGELGGGDNSVTLTQQEYEALTEEQKLDGLYYTYDTKRIYKNGVQYGASEPIPLTMAEYKALKEAGAIDEQQEYLIEANTVGILLGAEDIGYNNAESGIQATTVQGAIDKIAENGVDRYSTDEVKTNKVWINGKPIYRKVFKILKSELERDESVNTNRWYSPIFALTIDEIVNYDVLAFRNNGMVYKSVDYILNNSYSIVWTFSGFLFKDGSEIRIGSFMGDALYDDLSHIYGILYYTKS